jgi:hypothetical protein
MDAEDIERIMYECRQILFYKSKEDNIPTISLLFDDTENPRAAYLEMIKLFRQCEFGIVITVDNRDYASITLKDNFSARFLHFPLMPYNAENLSDFISEPNFGKTTAFKISIVDNDYPYIDLPVDIPLCADSVSLITRGG